MPGSGPRPGSDDSQALAAAQAAAPQDVAPAGAAHPLQEAVLALARDALGLIGALHNSAILPDRIVGLTWWRRPPRSPHRGGARPPSRNRKRRGPAPGPGG